VHGIARRKMNFTISMLQIRALGNQEHNAVKGLEACRKAKALGADLAVFPELWNIGMAQVPVDPEERQRWIKRGIGHDSDFVKRFAGLARELDLNIAITYLERYEPLPRNTVSILNKQGEMALTYSKVFICNFGSEELANAEPNAASLGCDLLCSPGESFPVATLNTNEGEVKVGAMICADREFPEPATQLMRNGAELIIIPNSCTWDEIRTAGLKTRAVENLVGVAMTNYPAPQNNGTSQAHTCVAWKNNEMAETLVARAAEKEEILLARFDLDALRAFRKQEQWRLNYRLARTAYNAENRLPRLSV